MSSGGKREGAGRPSKGDRVVLSVRIEQEVAERLKELATEREMTQGEVVEVAIMSLKRG
jgi:predicted DNA-binding protein